MDHILTLQWPFASEADFDDLIAMEEALADNLDPRHDVDGHDAGSGQMNIFVLTPAPAEAFRQSTAVLGSHRLWPLVRVAYRLADGNDYTILWPAGLREVDVV